jgi:hypothetical protein
MELQIKSYKQSNFRSNLVKGQKVKVTHGTTVRVTRGMSIHLSWHGDDVARSYRVMADMWTSYVMTHVSVVDKLYGATWPNHGLPRGTPPMVGV